MGNRLPYGLRGRGHWLNMFGGGEGEVYCSVASKVLRYVAREEARSQNDGYRVSHYCWEFFVFRNLKLDSGEGVIGLLSIRPESPAMCFESGLGILQTGEFCAWSAVCGAQPLKR